MRMTTRELGETIKGWRIGCGLTQRELARELDIAPTTISYIESGYAAIDLTRFAQVGAVCGIDWATVEAIWRRQVDREVRTAIALAGEQPGKQLYCEAEVYGGDCCYCPEPCADEIEARKASEEEL